MASAPMMSSTSSPFFFVMLLFHIKFHHLIFTILSKLQEILFQFVNRFSFTQNKLDKARTTDIVVAPCTSVIKSAIYRYIIRSAYIASNFSEPPTYSCQRMTITTFDAFQILLNGARDLNWGLAYFQSLFLDLTLHHLFLHFSLFQFHF